jgi:hypothetical protein
MAVDFAVWPMAATLWAVTLSLLLLTCLSAFYICGQRMLVTGKCAHSEMGKRLWQGIVPPQVFALVCIFTILWYESERETATALSPASATIVPCRAIFWLSHMTPSFYALPYIQRGLRMVVLFDTTLRKRYSAATNLW